MTQALLDVGVWGLVSIDSHCLEQGQESHQTEVQFECHIGEWYCVSATVASDGFLWTFVPIME